MKKILTSALISVFTCTALFAQINLEASYAPGVNLQMARFSGFGSKYVFITNTYDTIADTIRIYNLNHSIFKTIAVPQFPAPYGYSIQYITDALFDTDSTDIDYLIYVQPTTQPGIDSQIKIFEESGNLLLNLDSAGYGYSFPGLNGGVSLPVVTTDSGTKFLTWKGMFLGTNGSYQIVYSLPGSLPCDICGGNFDNNPVQVNEINMALENFMLGDPYPNPGSSDIKIEYSLPARTTSGEIVFYDIHGNEIKRYKVDHHFNFLTLNVKELSAGTYFYQLVIDGNISMGKKMVVISQ
ncbi:MAG TPA: T9SS type A sorting domain-containing protein [Bacteroidia bacterium]|nr:T9SS type A sorting domain-containing protein [Bacteroidia bacterium]